MKQIPLLAALFAVFIQPAVTLAQPSQPDMRPVESGIQVQVFKPIQSLAEPPQQLQTELAVKDTSPPAETSVAAPVVAHGCGDNPQAAFIYEHESGCDTTSTNSQGCFGIGQDCNGIVRSQCGADYACQNAYFTNYANSRYGGWAGAYSAWVSKGWW